MSTAENYDKNAAHCKEKYHPHSSLALLPTTIGMLEMPVVLRAMMLFATGVLFCFVDNLQQGLTPCK